MICIFEDGRIIYDKSLLSQEDTGKYLEFETMPEIPPVEEKVGVITGCNLEINELLIEYFDVPESTAEPPTAEPLTLTEQTIMQTAITTEYMAAMMESTI